MTGEPEQPEGTTDKPSGAANATAAKKAAPEKKSGSGGAKASAAKAPAAKEETSSRGASGPGLNLVTIAIAAVLGAALALGAQYALDIAGIEASPSTGPVADTSALVTRIDALESGRREVISSVGEQNADIATLRQTVTRLRADLNALDTGGYVDPSAELAALRTTIEDLAARLEANAEGLADLEEQVPTDLAQQLAAMAEQSALAAIEGRVADLEANALENDVRRAAMALGLAQVVQAAQGSAPFVRPLEALGSLRPDDPVIADLHEYASEGAPTFAMLRADFPPMARQVTRAAHRRDDTPALGRIWAWVTQAFTFRPTGPREGDGAAAVIARAELRLAEGNLAAAVEEMQNLPEEARDPAEDWIAGAQARLGLDRLITELSSEIVRDLGQ